MSNVLDRLHQADQPAPEQWYLRTEDGSVYGPVTIPVMRDWAAQSRVAPGDNVSPDGVNWLKAETVPELKMEWMAVLPDGSSYGPFNVLAVPNLHKNGSIPADASLVHAASGKTVKVAELIQMEHEDSKTPPGEPELNEALATLRRKYDALQEQSSRREKQFTKQIASMTAELESARTAVEELKSRERACTEQILSLESGVETSSKELEGTIEQLTQLNAHYEQLKQESARQIEELDAQNEAFMSEKQALREANMQLEEDCARNLRLVEQLRENMSQSDGSTGQLQKKLASTEDELNDLRRRSSIENDKLQHKAAELERKLNTASDQLARSTAVISEKSAELESVRSQSAALQDKLSREIQQLQQSLKSQKESFEAELSREKQKSVELSSKLSQAKDDVRADSSILQQTREKLSQIEHELEIREAQFSGDRNRLESALREAQDAGKAMAEKIRTLESQLTNDATGLNRTITDLRKQLETALGQKTEETEELTLRNRDLESRTAELAGSLAKLNTELQETRNTLHSGTESLRRTISEKDAELTRLNEELLSLKQAMQSTESTFRSLQADYRRIQEESSERETELRARVAAASEQFSELRDASDRQIAGLQASSEELKTRLETAQADNRQISARLEDTISRLADSERNAGKQKHSFDAKISQLEDQLAKKSSALEAVTANLSKTTDEAAKNEDKLRSTLRMLEKRDIAGRKLIHKLEKDLKDLEDTRRELTRQNGSLVEEVKDAAARIKLLRKQMEPLNRRIEAQEELLKRRLSSPPDRNASKTPESALLPVMEKLQIMLCNLKIALPPQRVAVIISAVIIAVIAISTARHWSWKAGTHKSPSSDVIEQKIQSFISLKPDLSVPPASGPLRSGQPAKVNAWPAVDVPGITVEYEDYEMVLTFNSPAFTAGTSMTETAINAVNTLIANYSDVLRKHRLTVTGLTEINFSEAGGNAFADYAMRIQRAETLRTLLLKDQRTPSLNVITAAGPQGDRTGRSVVISLSPLP